MENKYPVEVLRNFMEQAAEKIGVAAPDAKTLADNLLTANLWGVSSHGIGRFPVYFKRLSAGTVNPAPHITSASRYPSVIQVDGDNGLGSVVTMWTMKRLMELADQYGVASAGVIHSNHFGAAGYYCKYAADRGYITLMSTVGPANMAPFGGCEPYFSTNPFAVGMPSEDGKHIIVDMATSVVAKGKIREIARKGGTIPEGWAMDSEGVPTTDPQKAIDGLVMPMAGYKGSGIALAIEYLSGVSCGAGFGTEVKVQYGDDPTPANVGHSIVVMKQDAYLDKESYNARMERFCKELHSIKCAKGVERILLPGEKERMTAAVVQKEGISIDPKLLSDLQDIAKATGVAL